MADKTFFVGQEFPDVKSFRTAVKEAAIAQHFELRIIKSDLVRYFAKCSSEGCPWKIRAVKLPNCESFAVRSLDGTHTCGRTALEGHHQASVDWIVGLIADRLRDEPNYKPKEILHDIRTRYGITIPYKQAWRAKERGLAAIHGSSEESYSLLRSYFREIKRSNPGTAAEILTSGGGENRFRSLFVAFRASLRGFLNGCLPLIGLGSIPLKSKYLGSFLSATSFDPDGGLFPVAFGVVDFEDKESWAWFLSRLRRAFEENTESLQRIAFFSDGKEGVEDALRKEFPSSFHPYCTRYLSESFGKEFKNNRLVHLLRRAAHSTTATGFREKMAEIEAVSPEAAKWVQRFDPSRWALAFSEETRYGRLSSNVEEFHDDWIVGSRDLPVIQVIEAIHGRLVSLFEDRRSRGELWPGFLAPDAEKRLKDSIALGSSYRVLRSDETEFEVISSPEQSQIVNVGSRSCSCREWQLHGIPCSHAAAALLSCRKDVYAFAEKCFAAASYREAYAGEIFPVPRRIEWSKMDGDFEIVRPPKFRRAAGRPEKKRVCAEELNREKHTVRCSRCNRTGHYKTTCKAETMKDNGTDV